MPLSWRMISAMSAPRRTITLVTADSRVWAMTRRSSRSAFSRRRAEGTTVRIRTSASRQLSCELSR